MAWALNNHDEIVALIRKSNHEYQAARCKMEVYQERLYSHANQLVIAWRIFQAFCRNVNWDMRFTEDDFNRCINSVVADQIESLELDEPDEVSAIVPLIAAFEDAMMDDAVFKRPKKKYWTQSLYFDEKEGMLYIPGETLEKCMKAVGIDSVRFEVVNELERHGLLVRDKNKQNSRTKKLEGKRCYVIDYAKYREYVHEMVLGD